MINHTNLKLLIIKYYNINTTLLNLLNKLLNIWQQPKFLNNTIIGDYKYRLKSTNGTLED